MKNLLSSIWWEKNSTSRCSPLINTIKAPILSSNGVSVNGSVGDSVDGGRYRYVFSNMFIVIINCESGIPELQKPSHVILRPALTLSRSNCLSYEFSSRSRSAAAFFSLLPLMGASNKLSDGTSTVVVTFQEAA